MGLTRREQNMKFSISTLMSQHRGESFRKIFAQAVEQIQLGEAIGFHTVWITEQHFNNWGVCPDPLAFAAHLAGVTRRIRIGTGVVVLPLHNPLVIAERAALVDQLSGGRLELGIGKGHPKQRFDVFGLDADENEARFYEAHDLIVQSWTQKPLHFKGRFYQAESIGLVPRPLQHPHPPVWVATFGNPRAISFAAQHGYPLLLSSHGDSLTRSIETYSSEYQGTAPPTLSTMRALYVHPDGEKARRAMRGPAKWYINNNPARPATVPNNELAIHEAIHSMGIIGSPEECIERIRTLREEHKINNLICMFGPGGVPHSRIMESMRLFAKKVMPEFAA